MVSMDAVATLPTFYLLSAAAFGAVLAAVSIALVLSRGWFSRVMHARSLRALMRDSLKSKGR